MGTFRFSRRAEADLLEIGEYTLRTWGEAQTIRYIDDLETCCQQLADNLELGRPCDDIRPGLRRMAQGQHVVFYRQEPGGVLVSRILHGGMLPERHPIDDKTDGDPCRKSRRATRMLKHFRAVVAETYGSRLERATLLGSRGRGDAQPGFRCSMLY